LLRWILEPRTDRRARRLRPLAVAEALAARTLQRLRAASVPHRAGRADTAEGREAELEAMRPGAVWGFLDPSDRIAPQTQGSREGQCTACGLVAQAGRQTRADGRPLHRGPRACYAQSSSSVLGGRGIDAVTVGAQAALEPADVQLEARGAGRADLVLEVWPQAPPDLLGWGWPNSAAHASASDTRAVSACEGSWVAGGG
jgi:hypothetical protein